MEEESINNHNNTKKKTNKKWFLLVGVILIIGVIVLLWFLMRGETKTTGSYQDDEATESLSCAAKNLPYTFFKTTNTIDNIKVNTIFSNNKISSISFVAQSIYQDPTTARIQSDAHEGDMNISFANNGMKQFALSATYDINEDTAQMSLYGTSADINETSIRYFMLDSIPKNIDGYKKAYLNQGFNCEIVKK